MSKEEILEYFKDIDGMYNECTRYDDLKKMLSNLEEVKHGHWIEEIGTFLCSECGDSWGTEMEEMVRSFNYCPTCGAKMDEVKDETD